MYKFSWIIRNLSEGQMTPWETPSGMQVNRKGQISQISQMSQMSQMIQRVQMSLTYPTNMTFVTFIATVTCLNITAIKFFI